MTEAPEADDEMVTAISVVDRLRTTDTGRAGLVLLIVGLVGLIVVFSIPWMKFEITDYDWQTGESSKEEKEYKYKDFGDDFQEDMGSDDMDEYLHGSANFSLYGFLVILLAGIILSIQAFNGKVYDVLAPYLSSDFRSNPRHPEFLKVLLAVVVVVFTLMVVVSGTRFIGFANSVNESEDAGIEVPAGWIVFIIGIVLIVLEMLYLFSKLSPIMEDYGDSYRQTLHKYISVIALLSLVGLLVFSLFPVLNLEVDGEDGSRELEFNDGLIHVGAESSSQKDIDSDLGWMAFFLWCCFSVSLIALLGLMYSYYLDDENSGRFHFSISFGSLVLIFGILFLVVHLILFSHIKDWEDEIMEGAGDDEEVNATFGPNYLPLICGLGIIGLGALYTKEAYPVSIRRIIGIPAADEEEAPPAEQGPQKEKAPPAKKVGKKKKPVKKKKAVKKTKPVEKEHLTISYDEEIPEAKVEEAAEEEEETVFPVLTKCRYCHGKVKLRQEGKFKCPRCENVDELDDQGEFVGEIEEE